MTYIYSNGGTAIAVGNDTHPLHILLAGRRAGDAWRHQMAFTFHVKAWHIRLSYSLVASWEEER